jgi:hypothetical protein
MLRLATATTMLVLLQLGTPTRGNQGGGWGQYPPPPPPPPPPRGGAPPPPHQYQQGGGGGGPPHQGRGGYPEVRACFGSSWIRSNQVGRSVGRSIDRFENGFFIRCCASCPPPHLESRTTRGARLRR